jgi:hypothetical protein
MAKVWVLDTETKGTGAHVVPLEKVVREPAPEGERNPIGRKRVPPPPVAPAAPQSRRFKVVDVMTEQVLAEGASTRATVDLLEEVRAVVDVRIYVWEQADERWRLLTLGEQNALWKLRGQRPAAEPAVA